MVVLLHALLLLLFNCNFCNSGGIVKRLVHYRGDNFDDITESVTDTIYKAKYWVRIIMYNVKMMYSYCHCRLCHKYFHLPVCVTFVMLYVVFS